MAANPKAVQKQIRYPVPTGGIDTRDNMMAIGPDYGLLVNNLLARPTGLEVRKGYINWLPEAWDFNNEVRTLMFFSNPGGTNNKMFASTGAAQSPVYDVTNPNVNPAAPFLAQAGAVVEGEWSWTNYNTPTNAYLCAVLFGSGYYTYNTTTGWARVPVKLTAGAPAAGEIKFEYLGTTYDSSTMLFTFSWKNRLWFIQGGTGLAWYLPVNAIAGAAAAIDLGQFLKHGGGLAFATNWTYDSGDGMDDNLIFVGNNGDMVIYEGTDPATAANFRIKGVWYVGRIPPGRRGFCQYGGDVLMVTEYGIVSVADFVSGRITNPIDQSTVGAKFNPTLSRYVSNYIDRKYWQLISYPTEELIFMASPALDPETTLDLSFAMGHFSKAWTTFTNFPAYCSVVFQGQLFFGTKDGKLYRGLTGHHDKASYDGTIVGDEITGIFQTGFYDFGSPTANKRAQRIRLLGRSDGTPGYFAVIKSEYDMESVPVSPAPVMQAASLWDVAIWDNALWYSRAATFKKWFGVTGFGKKLSVQIAIRGLGATLLTDYEVTFEEGIGL